MDIFVNQISRTRAALAISSLALCTPLSLSAQDNTNNGTPTSEASAQELPFANFTGEADRTKPPKWKDHQSSMPLGLEAVTGYRSEYVYRGRQLSDSVLEFQLHGHFAYTDSTHLEYGAWYTAEIDDGDFQSTGLMFNFQEDRGKWTFGAGLRYRELSGSVFESGLELNTSVAYHFNSDQILSGEFSYDTGAEGFYGKIQYDHYFILNKDSYLNFRLGLSASAGYYEAQAFENKVEDGLNDIFARLTYTYNLTQQVSFTPFFGTSIQKDDATFYGGVWFETSF